MGGGERGPARLIPHWKADRPGGFWSLRQQRGSPRTTCCRWPGCDARFALTEERERELAERHEADHRDRARGRSTQPGTQEAPSAAAGPHRRD
jgi:hypothetical protein